MGNIYSHQLLYPLIRGSLVGIKFSNTMIDSSKNRNEDYPIQKF